MWVWLPLVEASSTQHPLLTMGVSLCGIPAPHKAASLGSFTTLVLTGLCNALKSDKCPHFSLPIPPPHLEIMTEFIYLCRLQYIIPKFSVMLNLHVSLKSLLSFYLVSPAFCLFGSSAARVLEFSSVNILCGLDV